ncbi:MAG TPA: hypothetical protein PKA05_22955 [Roseiflexaceae bacterium]|nr:hypothetical protein [Roseiflexaceae bacterium]
MESRIASVTPPEQGSEIVTIDDAVSTARELVAALDAIERHGVAFAVLREPPLNYWRIAAPVVDDSILRISLYPLPHAAIVALASLLERASEE